jgi:uncharacterized membrane protein YhhN
MPILLSASVLASALLHLRAEYFGPRWQVYLFKPLTTALILALALAAPAPVSGFYRGAVAAGLLCSLAGDVFLMLPRDRFVAGLASFLVAHLFYIAAFGSVAGTTLPVVALVPLLLYGALLMRGLWPHLGRLKPAVAIYAAVLLALAWVAAGQYLALREPRALLALAGAALFVLSDSALAINRFARPFRAAQLVVLSTYFAAQWLIALSVDAAGEW